MAGKLLRLRQGDVVDLTWFFKDARTSVGITVRAQTYEPQIGAHDAAYAASVQHDRLIGSRHEGQRFNRIRDTLHAARDVRRESWGHLEAAYSELREDDPEDRLVFSAREAGLARHTPTLRRRAANALIREERDRQTTIAWHFARCTDPPVPHNHPWDVIASVVHANERCDEMRADPERLLSHDEIEARAMALLRKSMTAIALVGADPEATKNGRAMIDTVRREARTLHDAAADAYIRGRMRMTGRVEHPTEELAAEPETLGYAAAE